jgi:hypothetical protein
MAMTSKGKPDARSGRSAFIPANGRFPGLGCRGDRVESRRKSSKGDKNVIAGTNCRGRERGRETADDIDIFSLGSYDFGLPFVGSG